MLHQLLRNPFSPCWTPLPELLKCPSFSYITNLTHEEPFSVELLLSQPTKGKQPARSLPPCILLNTQTKINSPKSTAHPAVPWPKCTVWEQILSSNTREPLLEFPGVQTPSPDFSHSSHLAQSHDEGAGGGIGEQEQSWRPAHGLTHRRACVQRYLSAAPRQRCAKSWGKTC